MRYPAKLLGLSLLLATQACYGIGALEALGGSCEQEQLVTTWHVTITRGGTVTSPLLTNTLTPSNIDQAQFNTLRSLLVDGARPGTYNVTWSLPAFNVNGGHISFTHAMPLSQGETQQVNATFSGGGWAAQAGAALTPAVSVRADNFTATSASGSITVLSTAPLRLQIDVTTRSASGETIRLTGDTGFAYQKVTKTCVDL